MKLKFSRLSVALLGAILSFRFAARAAAYRCVGIVLDNRMAEK